MDESVNGGIVVYEFGRVKFLLLHILGQYLKHLSGHIKRIFTIRSIKDRLIRRSFILCPMSEQNSAAVSDITYRLFYQRFPDVNRINRESGQPSKDTQQKNVCPPLIFFIIDSGAHSPRYAFFTRSLFIRSAAFPSNAMVPVSNT